MATFEAEDFLLVRELGEHRDAVDRAIGLLACMSPDTSTHALRQLPLGNRNAQLLDLREELFGRKLDAFAECPHCGEELELALDVDALRIDNVPEATELELAADGYFIRFRLVDSSDLKAAARCEDVESARALLVDRCVVEAMRDGERIAASTLPDEIIERIGDAMQDADPLAEMLIDVACPACKQEWQLAFDIASFLHAEIDAHARRLLREVHTIARGYGWSEQEILSMNARRRRDYMELLLQ